MVILSFDIGNSDDGARLWSQLSPAQTEVVRAMLEGLSDAKIAARRGCSRHTVSNLLHGAYRRLGVASRSELAALVRGAARLP
jgi:DNA-binding CsgD family transcriptional regulator